MTPPRRGEVAWPWALHWIAAMLFSPACSYPIQPQLARQDPTAGYRYWNGNDERPDPREEAFVAVSLSGGGTRAAAFAYGALEALRQTRLDCHRTMLDEVDVISSVSGGSFASAYLAAFGQEAFFRDFPEAMLRRKIHRGLALKILAPWNLIRLLSPRVGRGDLAAEYYDDALFHGRKFADLPPRPFVMLNATDISLGAQFSFTQEHFDRLCSDLSQIPVARGVAASSAFPVAFTPLTLNNYEKASCAYEEPGWMEGAAEDFDRTPQHFDLFRSWKSYEDAELRTFIHLSDGGLSDNLGLRAVETAIFDTDSWGLLGKINRGEVKHLFVLVVDAKPAADTSIDGSARAPGVYTVLNATGTNPMENYSSETVDRFRKALGAWNRDAADYEGRRGGCATVATGVCEGDREGEACLRRVREVCEKNLAASEAFRPAHPSLHFVHLRFAGVPDEEARKKLEGVKTSLQITPEQVELLRKWGRKLVEDSPEYRQLIETLKAESVPSASPCP